MTQRRLFASHFVHDTVGQQQMINFHQTLGSLLCLKLETANNGIDANQPLGTWGYLANSGGIPTFQGPTILLDTWLNRADSGIYQPKN